MQKVFEPAHLEALQLSTLESTRAQSPQVISSSEATRSVSSSRSSCRARRSPGSEPEAIGENTSSPAHPTEGGTIRQSNTASAADTQSERPSERPTQRQTNQGKVKRLVQILERKRQEHQQRGQPIARRQARTVPRGARATLQSEKPHAPGWEEASTKRDLEGESVRLKRGEAGEREKSPPAREEATPTQREHRQAGKEKVSPTKEKDPRPSTKTPWWLQRRQERRKIKAMDSSYEAQLQEH